MTVPVYWVNLNPDASAAGHWDESMIFDAMTRAMWHPAGAIEFEHTVIDAASLTPQEIEITPGSGAVVVIPARHHVAHVERLNAMLAALDWVLLIGSGDEEAAFDWSSIVHPRKVVWAMGAKPGKSWGVDRALGSGYSPGFPDLVRTPDAKELFDLDTGALYDVFFTGQVTHDRRRDCIDACKVVAYARRSREVYALGTDHFLADVNTGGLDRHVYARKMANAMVAPAPSGPESPDSFRLYEALEAGVVPVADGATPHGPVPGYWPFVFAEPVPFPVVESWDELPAIVEQVRERWPYDASRIAAWWAQWKRKFVYALDRDVRDLAGTEAEHMTPDDQITVILPTCPIPSHPDTAMIEEVVASIREQLPRAEIVIACDGVRPSMEAKRGDYEEFLLRLTRLCQRWSNVVPVILDEWSHQSGGTRAALELVTTPLLLFCEHDTPLTGEIDWVGLCEVVGSGEANMVRLHHETRVGPDHVHMALDDAQPHTFGAHSVPLIRTTQWSQRPHLATTAFYRDRVMPLFPADAPGTYCEWLLHSAIQEGIEHGIEQQWDKWRVCVYAPDGDNIQRSLHRDGRAGASTDDSVAAFEELRTEKAARKQARGEAEAQRIAAEVEANALADEERAT